MVNMASRFLTRCASTVEKASFLAVVFAAVCVGLLLVVVVGDAIACTVFDRPLSWSSDIQGLLLIYSLVMPAAYVLLQDDHIKLGFVSDRLSSPVRRAVEIVTMAAALVVFIVLTVQACQAVAFSYARGWRSGTPFGMPLWWSQLAVIFGSGFLSLQLAARLYRLSISRHSTGPAPSSTSAGASMVSDRKECSS